MITSSALTLAVKVRVTVRVEDMTSNGTHSTPPAASRGFSIIPVATPFSALLSDDYNLIKQTITDEELVMLIFRATDVSKEMLDAANIVPTLTVPELVQCIRYKPLAADADTVSRHGRLAYKSKLTDPLAEMDSLETILSCGIVPVAITQPSNRRSEDYASDLLSEVSEQRRILIRCAPPFGRSPRAARLRSLSLSLYMSDL